MTMESLLQNSLSLGGMVLIHATVLAALTWLICRTVLRNARPAVHAALWTIALVKFLVPPALPGEIALSSWLSRAVPALSGALSQTTPELSTATEMMAAFAEAPAPTPAAPSQAESLPVGAILVLSLYLVGLLWVAWRSWRSSIRARKQVSSMPSLQGPFHDEIQHLARRLGIKRPVIVRLCPNAVSPYVTNPWRPTLVLPDAALNIDASARRALVLHELAHIRRGDLFVRWLENAVRILFFFWPPVWWVCRRVERASEMACDQWALSLSRVQPDLYAASLLEIVKKMASPSLERRQLAFAGKTTLLEERFEMILKKNHLSPRLSWLMAPVLALWTVFSMAGGAAASQSAPQTSEQKKRVQTVVIGTSEELPREVLEKFPGADLNGDGVLTHSELREHLGYEPLHKERHFMIRGEAHGEGHGESHSFSEAKAMEKLLKKFPEADSNRDGKLGPEELKSYIKANPGVGGAYSFERSETGPHGAHLFIAGEGPHHGDFDLTVSSRQELMALHPETDANRDGQLSREEINEWGRARVGENGRFALKILSEEGGEAKAEAFVWAERASAGEADWTSEGGEKFVVKIRKSGDGEEKEVIRTVIATRVEELSEVEALASGDELAAGKQQRLLEKYPDADANGDGVLSKEEASALAAKIRQLKEKAKQP